MDQTYPEATPPAPAPEAAHSAKVPEKCPGKRPQEPPSEPQQDASDIPDIAEQPAVLHVDTLSKYEKDKVKRIVTPKATTGRLEVPQDVFELWQTPKGKEKLLSMWCKSGGVKDRCVADMHAYQMNVCKGEG